VVVISGTYGILYMDVLVMEPLLSGDGNLVVCLVYAENILSMYCIPTTITPGLFISFGHMCNSCKVEEVKYDIDIESFRILCPAWGQQFSFLRMLKPVQRRNSSSPDDFQKSQLLDRLSFWNMQMIVGKLKSLSISFMFSAESDSSHKDTRT
jgi:hypothetical protein